MAAELSPEDYEEPRCPLSTSQYKEKGFISSIPIDRVIEKYDAYIAKKDSASAERHLLYWLAEAEAGGDTHGRLTVINELMGHYRNTERRDEAYKYAALGLEAVAESGHDDRLADATTYINAATVYKSFGEAERAIPLFVRAKEIYEKRLAPGDSRLAGLYNNMALASADLGRFDEARRLYLSAIEIMKNVEGGKREAAISYLNLANAVEAQLGLEDGAEELEDCLDAAEELLDAEAGCGEAYYAYVCDRCAPTFDRYGRFAYAEELKERSRRIYDGA